MLDASPVLCAIFDDNFNITDVNQEAANMLKLAHKRDYIERFFDLSPEYQPDGMRSREKAPIIIRNVLQTGHGFVPEWMHITTDGEYIPVEVHLKRVKLGGKFVVIVYARDLRMEREMLAKLEAAISKEQTANNAKTKFLSNMSHEIRTPMNSILGIAELQLQKDIHPPETEEAFTRIHNSSSLLLKIINDILDLSKVEAGKLEIVPAPYDTTSLIVDTVQLNLMNIGSKNIDFSLHVDEHLPKSLIGDEIRVKQVLNNILSNAFKYTLEGVVTLSISSEHRANTDDITLIFIVRDTGQGMTKKQRNELFVTFKRFNLKRNRSIEGSGLGLTIAHELIQMMDGDITVESQPKKGSTFTIRLPQRKNTDHVLGPVVTASLQDLEDTQKSLKKISKLNREPMPYGRVLVVDDVESNLYVAKGFLMPYKIAVETADSGAQAIAKIEANQAYDIIFMDHMMPDMDGIETTKKIRELGYKHPIVALTANAQSGFGQLFFENDFSGFISKPIDIYQLDQCLIRFIRDKQPQQVIENARNKSVYKSSMAQSEANLPNALIESFLRDAKRTAEILQDIVMQSEISPDSLKTFIVVTHAIKSALLNVRMSALSVLAGTLEAAGREAKLNVVKDGTPKFLTLLFEVINDLEAKHGRSCTYEDKDPDFLREQLLLIKEACNHYDIEQADNALERARTIDSSAQTAALLASISDHLLCGEFEEAAELIG